MKSLESFEGYILAFAILVFFLYHTSFYPVASICFPPFGIANKGCCEDKPNCNQKPLKTKHIRTNFDGCGLR